jgi:nitrous oxidase accessory protein
MFDVSTNASVSQNNFSENFWSDYAGVDMNRDGFGDTPFHPVRLSSVLMEKFGVSVLLLKSFFFSIADEAESAFPVLTPDSLRDDRPLMKKMERISNL